MPIIQSAKKALRGSSKKKVFNLRRQKNVDAALKNIKKLVSEKNIKEAEKALSVAYKALDKAAKGGTIKKGEASRKKSRMSALIVRSK
ncbi:MAG TPA: 30S ribosomal protein S20 [Candidatus Paceibacterota bacterium]